MGAKIKPSDLASLTEYLPDPDVHLRNVDYKNESSRVDPNAPYHLAIEVLCKGLQKDFAQRTDNTILQTIKQRPDKAVEDFLHCREEVFNKYSGLASHLIHYQTLREPGKDFCVSRKFILDGRLPEVAAQTKAYVGWRLGMRLADLKRSSFASFF